MHTIEGNGNFPSKSMYKKNGDLKVCSNFSFLLFINKCRKESIPVHSPFPEYQYSENELNFKKKGDIKLHVEIKLQNTLICMKASILFLIYEMRTEFQSSNFIPIPITFHLWTSRPFFSINFIWQYFDQFFKCSFQVPFQQALNSLDFIPPCITYFWSPFSSII